MTRFNPEWLNRPRKRASPEAHLVRQIITYLRIKGFRAGKIKTHGVWDSKSRAYRADPYAWVGVPDILCFTPALVFIECKAGHNTQSSEQQSFQQLCTTAGIPYILAYSLEDVQKIM